MVPYELGVTPDEGQRVAVDGYITSVDSDHVELTTPYGAYIFNWRGPGLDSAFAVDEAAEIVIAQARIGLFPPRVSTLRSSSATAVAVAGTPWVVMNTDPGSTATLPGLAPELPELVYGLRSCCSERTSLGPRNECDYSALVATLDGSSAAIPLGETGLIGPWSVTNLQSTYHVRVELMWHIQVTLLGPTTPSRLDAGL